MSTQTGAVYEELYWPNVHSPANQPIDLASIVLDTQDIFAYAQHCHEATLALAMALHRTSTGDLLLCAFIMGTLKALIHNASFVVVNPIS